MLRSQCGIRSRGIPKAKRHGDRRRLRIEPLEDRRVLSIVVDTLVDENDGVGVGDVSLRDAISAATPGETIEFSIAGTILLEHGELLIDKNITINGPGVNLLTIDAANGSRAFLIDDGNGGAFAEVTITDLTITGGVTSGAGGGILNHEDLTVERSAIVGNQAEDGGGIGNLGGTFSIVDSTLSGNTATHSGGGIRNNAGTGVISNSTLSGNYAQYGGGVYIDTALAQVTTISNSTISGNTATDGGGGVYNFTGNAVIEFSTITNNKADIDRGGGLVSWGDVDITLTEVYSSIISGNLESDGSAGTDVDLVGGPIGGPFDTIESNGYNLVGTGSATNQFMATGDLPPGTDPLLGPLTDNGGPTLTHALLPDSQAIDAGDPSFATPPDFDQRGAPHVRVFGPAIDIGAFEFDTVLFVVDTLADNDDSNFSEGEFSLREAIGEASAVTLGSPVIVFDDDLFSGGPASINLTLGQLQIDAKMEIQGPGAEVLSINAQNNSRVLTVSDSNVNNLIEVTISGLTFTGGNDLNGGGAIFTQERLEIADSIITGNTAQWGGGVYNAPYGELTLLRSEVSGNTATSSGGGVYNYDGFVYLRESIISGNHGPDAAGIRNTYYGYLLLANSSVSGNISGNNGGGILNEGFAYIQDSLVSGNEAAFGAGAFNAEYSYMMIERSTMSGNMASSGGGGLFNLTATVDVLDSTISGNSAPYGGGLYIAGNIDYTTTIRNSTISGNTATESGGGIYNFGGAAVIEFSTITNNHAPVSVGSGIASQHPGFARIEIYSSIVAGNDDTDVALTAEINSFVSHGYNLIGTLGAGIDTFTEPGDQVGVTDPKLDPLADNGGPTWTHALQSDSPALNMGDSSAAAGMNGVPDFDQRGTGFDRVVGAAIDIGSYEAPSAPPQLLGDYNADTVVNAADYVLWRDTLGSTTNLAANGDDSNSVIDEADYVVWFENFGAEEGGGASEETRGASASFVIDRGTDNPVRPRSYRALHRGQECPPYASARMMALLDLLDSLPVRDSESIPTEWDFSLEEDPEPEAQEEALISYIANDWP